MTDQKTISLAQWCAYLPHFIKVRHIETGSEANLTIQNLEAILSSSFWAAGLKPLLRPMNEDNEAAINKIISDVSVSIKYGYSAFYDDNKEFEPINVYRLPHCIIQSLLAAHYDIFGLIEQNLALPIE